jgi:hypothetical protein
VRARAGADSAPSTQFPESPGQLAGFEKLFESARCLESRDAMLGTDDKEHAQDGNTICQRTSADWGGWGDAMRSGYGGDGDSYGVERMMLRSTG